MMVLNGEVKLECEILLRRKVTSGRKFAIAIRFMVNARDLQLKCARVLHISLFVPVRMYGSKAMM